LEGKNMENICEITMKDLTFLLEKKEISVKELVQIYIDRIGRIDQGEEGLISVLEINPEALTIADRLDKEHAANKSRLFGVPILLKDNIDTADHMHTSAGSLALGNSIAAADAEIVKVLRAKGAVILGKVNMTEFANYMTTGMPAGYSSRGGQVKSPYQKGADPSGSSTGSAVAVTANLCMASIGTDTSNSIISPGIRNGIVGYRPSMGALSQKGIIPISFTCDTAGPMTRTVEDAAIIFSEITGLKAPLESVPNRKDLTVGINEWALKNMNAEEGKKAETIIKEIQKSGISVKFIHIEPIPTEDIKVIQRFEFKYSINRYLSGLPKGYPIRSLKDIIDFNNLHEEQALRYGQNLLIDAEEKTRGSLNEPEYIEMLKDRERRKKQIHESLRGLNGCIMFRENLLLQYTGMPMITLPHGLYNDGMPFGISITSLTDVQLLSCALCLEKVVGQRVPPVTTCFQLAQQNP
jgi:amidase